MNKEIEIYNYSNPVEVLQKANDIFGEDIELRISTRKNKKYMIRGNFTNNKFIHFGQFGMEDLTKHKNERRLMKFRNRNWRWKFQEPYTAGYLSYYLLW